MTILTPIKITGKLDAILVNNKSIDDDITTVAVAKTTAHFSGLDGEDRHSGLTCKSDVRYRRQYAAETEIRNTRQITIVSKHELAAIAEALGIDEIKPEWLGANLMVSDIPDLTLLPPSTRLIFSSGAALVVDNENAPCRYPAAVIDQHHPGTGDKFIAAATHKRGLVAWVERQGEIAIGDTIAIHLPPRHIWSHG